MNTAILVDWALFHTNPYTQDFVVKRDGQAKLVLLVSDPYKDDYDAFSPYFMEARVFPVPDLEWDVVIRNTGKLPNVIFKAKALGVLHEASDLRAVIGLDADHAVNKMYREEGVLVTVEDF